MEKAKDLKLKAKSQKKQENIKNKKVKVAPEKTSLKKETSSDFLIPLKDLLEAGCHFGHQARRWNPKMSRFIYCSKDGVHIFDLVKTAECLQKACLEAKKLVSKGTEIVFVGTKRQAQAIIKEEAVKAGAPYVDSRWLGGTISNWPEIEKRIKKLKEMKERKEKGEYKIYTKKENLFIDREISRLERFFGGIASLEKAPQALFIIDPTRETTAVKEGVQAKAKIFAITDSTADPDLIDYPIPANDDGIRSIKLITETFAKAVAEGRELRKKTK
jgi:small subunit ribosomal protein S2